MCKIDSSTKWLIERKFFDWSCLSEIEATEFSHILWSKLESNELLACLLVKNVDMFLVERAVSIRMMYEIEDLILKRYPEEEDLINEKQEMLLCTNLLKFATIAKNITDYRQEKLTMHIRSVGQMVKRAAYQICKNIQNKKSEILENYNAGYIGYSEWMKENHSDCLDLYLVDKGLLDPLIREGELSYVEITAKTIYSWWCTKVETINIIRAMSKRLKSNLKESKGLKAIDICEEESDLIDQKEEMTLINAANEILQLANDIIRFEAGSIIIQSARKVEKKILERYPSKDAEMLEYIEGCKNEEDLIDEKEQM
jgi:hypothetical protein